MKEYFDKMFENNIKEQTIELLNRKEISEMLIDLFPNYNKLNEKEIKTLKSMLLLILLIYTKNNYKITKGQ